VTSEDFDWTSKGAIAGSPQIVRLELRATGDEPITVNALRVKVARRAAPLQGWFFANPGCGAEQVRVANVDLDAPTPTVEYEDTEGSSKQLTLSVTRTDVELIEIHARTRTAMVDWTGEVFYSGPDGNGSIEVDDEGRPFRVTSETESDGYRRSIDQPPTLEREPSWDNGIVAC
jgi:hypothetical protein